MNNNLINYIIDNDEEILKYSSISMIIFSIIAFILEMSGIYVSFHYFFNLFLNFLMLLYY